MKRNIKVVVHYPESGGHKIYFSTDLDMSDKDIIEYYRTRFQIEFCFRDPKQFTGLNKRPGYSLQMGDKHHAARRKEPPTYSRGLEY